MSNGLWVPEGTPILSAPLSSGKAAFPSGQAAGSRWVPLAGVVGTGGVYEVPAGGGGGGGTFSTAATGPRFYQPTNLGAGVSRLQWALKGDIPSVAVGDNQVLFSQDSTGCDLILLNNSGQFRLTVEDSDGTKLLSNTVGTNFDLAHSPGPIDVTLDVDMGAGTATLVYNGTSQTRALAGGGTGIFQETRPLAFLAVGSNANDQAIGDFERLAVYKNGSSTALTEITGPDPSGHPWFVAAT